AAAYLHGWVYPARLSDLRGYGVGIEPGGDPAGADFRQRADRVLFRAGPGGDRRDLPDPRAGAVDVGRLQLCGGDLRWVRALHCNLADRPHRLAAVAEPLRDRRGDGVDNRDLAPQ